MFTGIVEEMGTIRQIQRGRASAVLTIGAHKVLEDAHIGDSIAVNGICLTVTSLGGGAFTADVMHETLRRTSLSGLGPGSRVNLERAMAADGRFGGHIVSGHWYTFRTDPKVLRYIVEKGSITIDGISLTVADVTRTTFSISAIPHTVRETVLQFRKKGDTVNLETDIIGKYVEKLLYAGPPEDSSGIPAAGTGTGSKLHHEEKKGGSGLTEEFLRMHGF